LALHGLAQLVSKTTWSANPDGQQNQMVSKNKLALALKEN
jgi:hypothetical protein